MRNGTISDNTRSNIEIGREEKEQRRNKRKNHTHALPIRESINEDNFVFILDLVKGNNLIAARKKSAIILLYLTGLNVSSLTLFTVRNRTELLEKGATTIPLIIGGKPKVYIKFCDKGTRGGNCSKSLTLSFVGKPKVIVCPPVCKILPFFSSEDTCQNKKVEKPFLGPRGKS